MQWDSKSLCRLVLFYSWFYLGGMHCCEDYSRKFVNLALNVFVDFPVGTQEHSLTQFFFNPTLAVQE